MNFQSLFVKIFSAEIGAKFIFAIISLTIIRLMPSEQFALYSIALTTLSLVVTLLSSASNVIFIVGDFDKEDIKPSNFLSFQFILTLVSFVFLFLFKEIYQELFWITLILVISQVSLMFLQTCFQRSMDFRSYYKVEFLRVFLFLLAFFFIVVSLASITAESVLFAQMFSSVVVFFIFGLSVFSAKDFFDYKGLSKIFRLVFSSNIRYLFAYFVCITVMFNCDIILLGIFSDSSVVASFSAGFRYYAILQLSLVSINKILLPYIQKEKDYKVISGILIQHTKFAKYFLFVIILGIIASEWIIPLVDGNRYPDSVLIFQVLAVSSFVSFMFSPYINIVFKENDYLFLFKVVSVIMPLHIVLNIYIQGRFGGVGIAVLDLVSYGLFNVLVYYRAKRHIFVNDISG